MKVAIVAPSPVPYGIGGAEKLWWGLLNAINQYTAHQAELIKIPSPERTFPELIASYQAFSRLDLSHFDLIISTKYPGWMVHHHNHTVYLQHRLRGLYDTYPAGLPKEPGSLPAGFSRLKYLLNQPPDRAHLEEFFGEVTRLLGHDPALFAFPGPLSRAVIHHLDGIALSPDSVCRYLAISHNVAARADYFPLEAEVEVLHHPEYIHKRDKQDYRVEKNNKKTIFTASRLDPPKRIDLLIRAFIKVKGDVRFQIAGTGPEEERLKKLAADDPRIHFLGWCTDAEIAQAYNDCLFVPFIPADEDYGLVTIEAMRAARPVLTTTDSGGVNELVKHHHNGLVAEPDPGALAEAMQQLLDNPDDTVRMGRDACETVAPITWEKTIQILLRPKPLIVVTTTFPIYPPRGGGQSRIYHLYRRLARYADIILLTLTDFQHQTGEITIQPGLREIRILKSLGQQDLQRQLALTLNASIDDIVAIDNTGLTPKYGQTLASVCADADLVIVSHPYLYHEIRTVWKGPVWYEAHNVEADIKADILKAALEAELPEARDAMQKIREIEAACCRDSSRVLVVSHEDGDRLTRLYKARNLTLVPNGVDLESTPFVSIEEREDYKQRLGLAGNFTAIFMGSWHGPNIEAVEHIINMAPSCPDIDFLIMGNVCDAPLPPFPPTLHRLGLLTEEEKACVLGAADIAVNPMQSGSGTNLKMLDYAAAGLLILTTPFGNRGLKFTPDIHLLTADPADFPSTLNRIAEQGIGQYRSLTTRARAMAEEHYSWTVIADRLFLALD